MIEAVAHSHRAQRPLGAPAALRAPQPGVGERQLDVDERARARHEVEALKHEADLAVAQVGEIVLVHVADVHAVDQIATARGYVQAAEDVHQRALAAARAAHDRHEITGIDAQRYVAQRAHADLPKLEDLADVVHVDDRMLRMPILVPRRGTVGCLATHQRPAARDSRAGLDARAQRAAHQPPPLNRAAPPLPPAKPPPPRPPPPRAPPRRPPSLEARPLELVVLATGRATFSPAFRPLRTIVELLPARPVTTRRRSCLLPCRTVTVSGDDRAGRHVDAFFLLDDDFGDRAHADLQA